MQLKRATTTSTWDGTIPVARDWRIVGLVVLLAVVAASLNVPYGGVPFALVAFAMLVSGGVAGHIVGERRLRRITAGLVDHWTASGVRIEGVTRTAAGVKTEWTVHTTDGPVTIGGLAFAPLSTVSVEWRGADEVLGAREVENRLDSVAEAWQEEIFARA